MSYLRAVLHQSLQGSHEGGSLMGSLVWKGTTTLRRYEFIQQTIPAVLLNVYGQPVVEGTYNGETVIQSNHDGSVALPVATGPPYGAVTTQPAAGSELNSIYDAYVLQSPWTEAGFVVLRTTPVRVQSFGNAQSTVQTSIPATGTVTAGNLLLVVTSQSNAGTGATIADTLGNAWTALPVPGGNAGQFAWYGPVTTGGSDTIIVQLGASSPQSAISVLEVTGQDGSNPIDVWTANHGASLAPNSGATAVPASPNDLVVGLAAQAGGTIAAMTFAHALAAQTNEPEQSSFGGTANVVISNGPSARAGGNTFSATNTVAGAWSAWCILISGVPA